MPHGHEADCVLLKTSGQGHDEFAGLPVWSGKAVVVKGNPGSSIRLGKAQGFTMAGDLWTLKAIFHPLWPHKHTNQAFLGVFYV